MSRKNKIVIRNEDKKNITKNDNGRIKNKNNNREQSE